MGSKIISPVFTVKLTLEFGWVFLVSQLLFTRSFLPLFEIFNAEQLIVLQDVQTYFGASTPCFLIASFLFTSLPHGIITWALIFPILTLCIIEGP